jgi:peptidoglycan hydrolase-like protein with peptidoglycan-binding domain
MAQTVTTTATTRVSVGCFQLTQDLTVNDRGADVIKLQIYLGNKGYLKMVDGIMAGFFGFHTQQAVIALQKAAGITPANGYVGSATRAYIAADTCRASAYRPPVTPSPKYQ